MTYFIDQTEVTKEEYYKRLAEIKDHMESINNYVEQIHLEITTIEDVPEEYRAEVEEIINQPAPPEANNSYGVDNDTYNQIIDDYTMELIESGVIA